MKFEEALRNEMFRLDLSALISHAKRLKECPDQRDSDLEQRIIQRALLMANQVET
jgi:hypothetical protein